MRKEPARLPIRRKTMAIKRGVSLYSYQNETFQGKMSLEDCIRTSAELGANGIEIIGEQTFWGWPEVGVTLVV